MFSVYKILNKINGKIYIGQTQNIKERWKHHIYISKKPNDKNYQLIHKAIAKYGVKNFTIKVIETHKEYQKTLQAETKLIAFYKTNVSKYGSKFGYNFTDGGEGWFGHKHTEETKEKLRLIRLGKKASKETKKKMSDHRKGKDNGMFGKHHSKLSRKKISKTRIESGITLGENNPKAKLTEVKVREIKILLKEDKLQQKEIAKIYNVCPSAIQKIASELNWNHIIV